MLDVRSVEKTLECLLRIFRFIQFLRQKTTEVYSSRRQKISRQTCLTCGRLSSSAGYKVIFGGNSEPALSATYVSCRRSDKIMGNSHRCPFMLKFIAWIDIKPQENKKGPPIHEGRNPYGEYYDSSKCLIGWSQGEAVPTIVWLKYVQLVTFQVA